MTRDDRPVATADRLVAAAARLLDQGGQEAVTLRAVATATDVSHNAPYKHFASRRDLLSAVAAGDFSRITERWRAIRDTRSDARARLVDALDVVVAFSQEHPARYRLLFGTPDVAARDADAEAVAEPSLQALSDIVADCQREGSLPQSPSDTLAILLFATVHGLIDADASELLRARTGWPDLRTGVGFALDLIGGAVTRSNTTQKENS